MAESTLTSITTPIANAGINTATTNTNRPNRPNSNQSNNKKRPNSKRSSHQSQNSYYNNNYNYQNNNSNYYYSNNANASNSYYDYNQYQNQEKFLEDQNKNQNQSQNQNKQSQNMKSSSKTKQANNKANKINTATQNNGKNLKEQNKLINEIKEVKQKKRTENETRTEILIEQLIKNNYECMVCCYAIRHDTAIWCCPCCNHIFHLFCIKKWARSPVALLDENSQSWRCPGCQTPIENVPNKYKCFCSKKIDPEFNKHITPHSCGECCGKPKNNPLNINCIHKCTLLCHPGPCPQCEAMIYKQCGCGKLKFQVKCNSAKIPICENKCNKILNCGIHACELKCHPGNCCSCDINIEQRCYSHDTLKVVQCGTLSDHNQKQYLCNQICNKLLNCKEHRCEKLCHSGACNECPLLPENLKSCPCGKTLIYQLLHGKSRVKCTDDIPTCQKTCDKLLKCSDNDSFHFCQSKCHHGDCSRCEKVVKISCRCGSKSEELPCFEAQKYKENPLFCEKRCTKKLSCTRHRCSEICCDNKEHLCTFICNRMLNCGKHNCDQLCHKGNCMKCTTSSYNEWSCHCGNTVVLPPIKCGTKLPDCPHPCDRKRECEHPVQHSCHSEDTCPPCSFLTAKMCMGNHELRHSIPCYMKDVSCGFPCGKELPCGKHKCIKTCHKGVCLEAGETCNQPCQIERLHCIHPCLSPCHDGVSCPDTICQAQVVVKCKCGFKSKQVKCLQRYYDSSSIVFENLATEIKEMLSCKTVDINSFRNTEVLKKKHELACDEECLIAERNRNLANALQIDPNNPTPKQLLKTIYSEFLKNFARDEQNFALYIEKELALLIKELNNSKQANKKCLNFPVMKSIERRFIHEICPYYNLETQSQDAEPNRNVRVYATKDKSCVPAQTLTQSLEIKPKQNIIPHVSNLTTKQKTTPSNIGLPIYNQENKFEIRSSFAILGELNESDTEEILNKVDSNTKSKGKAIDYFDMTE